MSPAFSSRRMDMRIALSESLVCFVSLALLGNALSPLWSA